MQKCTWTRTQYIHSLSCVTKCWKVLVRQKQELELLCENCPKSVIVQLFGTLRSGCKLLLLLLIKYLASAKAEFLKLTTKTAKRKMTEWLEFIVTVFSSASGDLPVCLLFHFFLFAVLLFASLSASGLIFLPRGCAPAFFSRRSVYSMCWFGHYWECPTWPRVKTVAVKITELCCGQNQRLQLKERIRE